MEFIYPYSIVLKKVEDTKDMYRIDYINHEKGYGIFNYLRLNIHEHPSKEAISQIIDIFKE